MLLATTVLQLEADEIRKFDPVYWRLYKYVEWISEEDYLCISALDSGKRTNYLLQNSCQSAKTCFNLLDQISEIKIVKYILMLIDDILQEDRSRAEIFHIYAEQNGFSVWEPFQNFLSHSNRFINNMSSRIITKLACWNDFAKEMPKSDAHFYLEWLKDQFESNEHQSMMDLFF